MTNWVRLVLLQIPYRMHFSGIVSNRTMVLTVGLVVDNPVLRSL